MLSVLGTVRSPPPKKKKSPAAEKLTMKARIGGSSSPPLNAIPGPDLLAAFVIARTNKIGEMVGSCSRSKWCPIQSVQEMWKAQEILADAVEGCMEERRGSYFLEQGRRSKGRKF